MAMANLCLTLSIPLGPATVKDEDQTVAKELIEQVHRTQQ
jgi:hypothetical protein